MFNLNLYHLLCSAASGAATGYITNSIAVNMLFKKYFGLWGGVIEDHYLEFIENMSRLVETDLLNARTIAPVFADDTFKKELYSLVKSITEKHLGENSLSMRIADINDIDTSIHNIVLLAQECGINTEKKVADIISQEQCRSLIKQELPGCIKGLSGVVEDSRGEIEHIIDNAVNLRFKAKEGGGFFGALKDHFISSIAVKYKIVDKIITFINNHAEVWTDTAVKRCADFMQEKSIGDCVWNSIKEEKLDTVYRLLNTKAASEKITDFLLTILKLNNNIDFLLTKNIAALTKKQLEKLRPKEVNVMVQDFMGRELKPLNLFGAFLGAIAGALIAVFTGNPFAVQGAGIWQILALYAVVFAATGIGTNWIAIKMLFRPRSKVLGINIPPFIGVIPKRKDSFGAGLSRIVAANILDAKYIEEQYLLNEKIITEKVSGYFSNDNYAVIGKLLNDNAEKITSVLCKRLNDIPNSALSFIINPIKDQLADYFFNILQMEASRNREAIKTYIIESIGDDSIMGVLEYAFARIALKDDIDAVVDTLIDALPSFLQNKKTQIIGAAAPLFEHKLSDIGFDTSALCKEPAAFFAAALPKLNDAVTSAAKDAVCKSILLPAVFAACKDHIAKLIQVLNIESLIKKEVAAMPPQTIETMFYRIGGVYFSKITLYGWIGMFGGLLSCTLSLIFN